MVSLCELEKASSASERKQTLSEHCVKKAPFLPSEVLGCEIPQAG